MEMTHEAVVNAIRTAFDWHGGGGSDLYRFASNRKIDDEAHRGDLRASIRVCMTQAGNDRDHRDLEALYRVVSAIAINHEVCTHEDVGEGW
jgi:hypothetical protein